MTSEPTSCKRCQNEVEVVRGSSESYPQTRYLLHRARALGLRDTARRLLTRLGLRPRPAPLAGTTAGVSWPEVLKLQPGELVEVRPKEEILATLDEGGNHKGMVFMPEMLEYCGRQFRVYKRVERLIIETTGEARRMKNTVLLDGVICDGWDGACDRSCFYFWREAWLRRVEG